EERNTTSVTEMVAAMFSQPQAKEHSDILIITLLIKPAREMAAVPERVLIMAVIKEYFTKWRQQQRPIMSLLPSLSQVTAQFLESGQVTADFPESSQVSAVRTEARHVSAVHSEPRYVSADLPEPRHVTLVIPEPRPVMVVLLQPSSIVLPIEPVIKHQRLASNVKDPLLVSARAAGIPKPALTNSYVPEVIPMSAALPIWGIAFCILKGATALSTKSVVTDECRNWSSQT
ncbi:hypothetical protein M9458_029686, partial [Cirrhinus mrigala]